MPIEGINIAFLFFIVMAILARFVLPNKFWLALIISALLGPFGHFYIKKGFSYFLIILFFSLLMASQTQDDALNFIATGLFSLCLMLLRFKIAGVKKIEQNN